MWLHGRTFYVADQRGWSTSDYTEVFTLPDGIYPQDCYYQNGNLYFHVAVTDKKIIVIKKSIVLKKMEKIEKR